MADASAMLDEMLGPSPAAAPAQPAAPQPGAGQMADEMLTHYAQPAAPQTGSGLPAVGRAFGAGLLAAGDALGTAAQAIGGTPDAAGQQLQEKAQQEQQKKLQQEWADAHQFILSDAVKRHRALANSDESAEPGPLGPQNDSRQIQQDFTKKFPDLDWNAGSFGPNIQGHFEDFWRQSQATADRAINGSPEVIEGNKYDPLFQAAYGEHQFREAAPAAAKALGVGLNDVKPADVHYLTDLQEWGVQNSKVPWLAGGPVTAFVGGLGLKSLGWGANLVGADDAAKFLAKTQALNRGANAGMLGPAWDFLSMAHTAALGTLTPGGPLGALAADKALTSRGEALAAGADRTTANMYGIVQGLANRAVFGLGERLGAGAIPGRLADALTGMEAKVPLLDALAAVPERLGAATMEQMGQQLPLTIQDAAAKKASGVDPHAMEAGPLGHALGDSILQSVIFSAMQEGAVEPATHAWQAFKEFRAANPSGSVPKEIVEQVKALGDAPRNGKPSLTPAGEAKYNEISQKIKDFATVTPEEQKFLNAANQIKGQWKSPEQGRAEAQAKQVARDAIHQAATQQFTPQGEQQTPRMPEKLNVTDSRAVDEWVRANPEAAQRIVQQTGRDKDNKPSLSRSAVRRAGIEGGDKVDDRSQFAGYVGESLRRHMAETDTMPAQSTPQQPEQPQGPQPIPDEVHAANRAAEQAEAAKRVNQARQGEPIMPPGFQPKGESNAAQVGQVEQGRGPEHPGTQGVGQAAEAGGGNRPEQGAGRPEAEPVSKKRVKSTGLKIPDAVKADPMEEYWKSRGMNNEVQLVNEAAERYGVAPHELHARAGEIAAAQETVAKELDSARKRAVEATGIKRQQAEWLANKGFDYTSTKLPDDAKPPFATKAQLEGRLRQFNDNASNIAGEHPALSSPSKVWDLLHQEPQKAPRVTDDAVLKEAARSLKAEAKAPEQGEAFEPQRFDSHEGGSSFDVGKFGEPEKVGAGPQPGQMAAINKVNAALQRKGVKPSTNPVANAVQAAPKSPAKYADDLSPRAVTRINRDLDDEARGVARNRIAAAYDQFGDFALHFGMLPKEAQLAAEMRYFRGEPEPDRHVEKLFGGMRKLMRGAADEVDRVTPGKLKRIEENEYIKGMYAKNDDSGDLAYVQQPGRRSDDRPKGFLKPKTFANHEEAIAAGYHEVTNLVERQLYAYREKMHYVAVHDAFNQSRALGGTRFVLAGTRDIPEDWVKRTDKMGTVDYPNIHEWHEATDLLRGQKLDQVMADNGIKQRRTTEGPIGETRGKNINVRVGSETSVKSHEIGHVIGKDPDFLKSVTRFPEWNADPKYADQMKALADARWEGQHAPQKFKDYVRTPAELAAVVTQAYTHAPELMQRLAPDVLKNFEGYLDRHPNWQGLREAKPSLTISDETYPERKPGMVHLGDWYVPREHNRALENYCSPTLGSKMQQRFGAVGGAVTAGAQFVKRLTTSIGLFGMFHVKEAAMLAGGARFGTAGLRFTQAIRRWREGDASGAVSSLGAGLGQAARGVIVPWGALEGAIQGTRIEREQLNPGTSSSQYVREAASRLTKGAERTRYDPSSDPNARFRDAVYKLREATGFAVAPAAGRAALRYMEKGIADAMSPIMNFARAQGHINTNEKLLASDTPDDPVAQRRQANAMTAMGEEVFGQMNTEKMDAPRSVVQGAQLAATSPFWTFGNLKWAANVGRDVGTTLGRFKRGEPIVTPRMADVLGTLTMLGVSSSVYASLKCGRLVLPTSLKDMVYPLNGETNPDGSPGRSNIMAWPKDFYNWAHHPIDTFISKMAAPWRALAELAIDRDHYNDKIYNDDLKVTDPQRLGQQAKYLGKTAQPYALQNIQRRRQSGGGVGSVLESIAGITPASGDVMRSAAMNLAKQYRDEMGRPVKTPDEAAADEGKYAKLDKAMRDGGIEKLKQAAQEEVDAKRMTPKQKTAAIQYAQTPPLIRYLKHVSGAGAPDKLVNVWNHATPEERTKEFHDFVKAKINRAKATAPDAEQQRLRKLAAEAGISLGG